MTERVLDATLYAADHRVENAIDMLNRNTLKSEGEVRMLDTRFSAIMAELQEARRTISEVRGALRQEGVTRSG